MSVVNPRLPALNGITPSWANLTMLGVFASAPILEITDFKSITGSNKVEVGRQQGASGGRDMYRTTGKESHEASCEMYMQAHQKLLRQLAALGDQRGNETRIGLVHWGLEIQYELPGDEEIYIFRIKGIRYMGRTITGTEGTDPQVVSVNLDPIRVVDVVDGKELVLL